MDTPQIEQELEDLESKLERLRALYEQYFLGMEKLEPLVLRKDVDRKFWVLRREKIRNTGLRFKFQMLVQRYNTYQQYWTRVVREIESGTYRRDIIKVAQRFGEKEANTMFGRKRAEQYRRLAANQLERRAKSKALSEESGGDPRSQSNTDEEEPISLGADDIEMVSDDLDEVSASAGAPPPHVVEPKVGAPPPRGPTKAPGASTALPRPTASPEPDMEALLMFATVGVTTWRNVDASHPSAAPRNVDASHPSAAPLASAPEAPATAKAEQSAKPTNAPQTAVPAVSAKSRVAELAAQMRAKKLETSKGRGDDLALDDLFDGDAKAKPSEADLKPKFTTPSVTPSKPSAAPAATSLATPTRPTAPADSAKTAAPKLVISSATPPKPTPPNATASPIPAAPKPTPPTATASPIAAPKPTPPTTMGPVLPASTLAEPPLPDNVGAKPPSPPPRERADDAARQAARREEQLSEQKMREIYARYVGAKRAANESTAGITFDKLAASLKAQADKLKGSHPTKKVDFEVVTKDGKTALRPVLK